MYYNLENSCSSDSIWYENNCVYQYFVKISQESSLKLACIDSVCYNISYDPWKAKQYLIGVDNCGYQNFVTISQESSSKLACIDSVCYIVTTQRLFQPVLPLARSICIQKQASSFLMESVSGEIVAQVACSCRLFLHSVRHQCEIQSCDVFHFINNHEEVDVW